MSRLSSFSGLKWVGSELYEVIRKARDALEEYVEGGGETAVLGPCVEQLHQICGVLEMLQLRGAGRLAEEMQVSALALQEGQAETPKEAAEALMLAMIQLPDYLEKYNPDALRYTLSMNMPELGDSDFSWREFLRRNNNELVATFGNLAHRVLTFTIRNFDGVIPSAGELDDQSRQLLDKAEETLLVVGQHISDCRFKEGIKAAMSLAQDANRYLDDKAPWKMIKQDKQAAASSVYVALSVLAALKIILYPYLPFTCQKLHHYLGFSNELVSNGWKTESPIPGKRLPVPEPLFTKLDESIIDEEMKRLGT